MRDPNARQPQKIGGTQRVQSRDSQAPAARRQPIPLELIDTINADGAPDLQELESRGLLPKFLRLWNNPATLRQLKTVSRLLKAEGIKLKDKAAVRAWAEKHKDTLDPSAVRPEQAAQQKPFINSGPSVGRNDPCPCGGGKKFKKCCAGKSATP